MEERKVLVVAYYFPPMGLSGVQRILKFVKYLPEFGWKPVVLTDAPKQYYAYDETLLEDIVNDDIIVYRTGNYPNNTELLKTKQFPSYLFQKAGRAFLQTIYQPDSKIPWKKPALKMVDRIVKEHSINVVLATAPPFTDFLIAKEINQKYRIPFLIDYRDEWIENPFHFYATPFHKLYSIKLEREILQRAHKTIMLTRRAKEILIRRHRFVSHNDVSIIPHGFDPQDFQKVTDIKPDSEKFTITHSGLFQDNRTPKYFLQAVSQFLNKNKEARDTIEARFIGLMRKRHLKYVKKYNLENVVNITGYLNHSETISNLASSDVLWLMLDDSVRTPGKMFEYFGAKKTMLVCAPEGAIRQIALESKAALITDPKDVNATEKAITDLYRLWKARSLPVPSDAFISRYDRRILTEELARELSLASDK